MHKITLLMLTLAVGYWVLTLAQTQPKPLDKLGRIIGGLILIGALIGAICISVCRLGCAKGWCPPSGGGKMMCSMGAGAPCGAKSRCEAGSPCAEKGPCSMKSPCSAKGDGEKKAEVPAGEAH